MTHYYFERALFIIGEPRSGKSTEIRSMFRDVRLGTQGIVPDAQNLAEMYRLSNERCVYIRLTSPHEMGECIDQEPNGEAVKFLDKTEGKIIANTPHVGRRWNFVCPLQPNATKNMPNVVGAVGAFVKRFDPERTRVLFLSPDCRDASLQDGQLPLLVGLRAIPSVEIAWIDARQPTPNGLLIADFFDFT